MKIVEYATMLVMYGAKKPAIKSDLPFVTLLSELAIKKPQIIVLGILMSAYLNVFKKLFIPRGSSNKNSM